MIRSMSLPRERQVYLLILVLMGHLRHLLGLELVRQPLSPRAERLLRNMGSVVELGIQGRQLVSVDPRALIRARIIPSACNR